jgi:hypothetical protein
MDEMLSNYKKELLTLLEKSSDNFERQLNYISAGAIGISMIFIEKIVDITYSNCKVILILSWVFFILTLVGNLVSHIYTFSVHSKTIEQIDNEQYDYVEAKKRNDNIKMWNIVSAIILILGIVSLVSYVSINI